MDPFRVPPPPRGSIPGGVASCADLGEWGTLPRLPLEQSLAGTASDGDQQLLADFQVSTVPPGAARRPLGPAEGYPPPAVNYTNFLPQFFFERCTLRREGEGGMGRSASSPGGVDKDEGTLNSEVLTPPPRMEAAPPQQKGMVVMVERGMFFLNFPFSRARSEAGFDDHGKGGLLSTFCRGGRGRGSRIPRPFGVAAFGVLSPAAPEIPEGAPGVADSCVGGGGDRVGRIPSSCLSCRWVGRR